MLMDLYISNWLLRLHYFKGGPTTNGAPTYGALQESVASPNCDGAVCTLLLDLYLFP